MDLDQIEDDFRRAHCLLMSRLSWERDRTLVFVREFAEKHGEEEAKRMLAEHTAYILEQATQ